jgi:plastocyanin
MSTRRGLGFLLAVLLGAGVVLLPAIAASETGQTITAENLGGGIYGESHAWTPPQVTVTQNGTVTLSNPTEVKHGVEWVSAPATPICSSGVPVGNTEAASNTKWSGTCTFTAPGTYIFYCTVHHAAMTGRVTVAANGITTTTTTTPTSSTTTTTSTAPGESATSATGAPSSPLAGGEAKAVKVLFNQRGKSVRGSVAVSPAGAGGRLQVDLLARRASLASVGQIPLVRVGRTVHTSLQPGRVPFSVPLTTRARDALRRHGRLALSVNVIVSPASGAGVRVTRSVVLHP